MGTHCWACQLQKKSDVSCSKHYAISGDFAKLFLLSNNIKIQYQHPLGSLCMTGSLGSLQHRRRSRDLWRWYSLRPVVVKACRVESQIHTESKGLFSGVYMSYDLYFQFYSFYSCRIIRMILAECAIVPSQLGPHWWE